MSRRSDEPAVPLEYARPQRGTHARRAWRITTIVIVVLIGAPFGAGVLLDALRPPHDRANRVKCACNMRQIGIAIAMYANNYHGTFPNDLATILANDDLTPAVFTCPESNDTPAVAPTTQAALTAFTQPGHCSYVYLGKGLTIQTATPDVVVLYEPLSNHGGSGMNVMFGDNHVAWLPTQQAQPILKQIAAGVWPVRDPAQISATAPTSRINR